MFRRYLNLLLNCWHFLLLFICCFPWVESNEWMNEWMVEEWRIVVANVRKINNKMMRIHSVIAFQYNINVLRKLIKIPNSLTFLSPSIYRKLSAFPSLTNWKGNLEMFFILNYEKLMSGEICPFCWCLSDLKNLWHSWYDGSREL